MTHKEELKINIELLESHIESPIFQCDTRMAMISRDATRNNYEAFIRKEISEKELEDNNYRIRIVINKFMGMCSCMRESKR